MNRPHMDTSLRTAASYVWLDYDFLLLRVSCPLLCLTTFMYIWFLAWLDSLFCFYFGFSDWRPMGKRMNSIVHR
jgi:hypothetical protein